MYNPSKQNYTLRSAQGSPSAISWSNAEFYVCSFCIPWRICGKLCTYSEWSSPPPLGTWSTVQVAWMALGAPVSAPTERWRPRSQRTGDAYDDDTSVQRTWCEESSCEGIVRGLPYGSEDSTYQRRPLRLTDVLLNGPNIMCFGRMRSVTVDIDLLKLFSRRDHPNFANFILVQIWRNPELVIDST